MTHTRRLLTMSAALSLLAAAAGAQDATAVPELDEALARQVYGVAELWVQREQVPRQLPLNVPVRGAAAVCATIRRSGMTFGIGIAKAPDPTLPRDKMPPIDLLALCREAVDEALKQDVGRNAELRKRAGPPVLDLQIARPLELVRVERFSELPGRVQPGLHGLALARDGVWAWQFPANALAANLNLQSQLRRLMSPHQMPLTDLPKLGGAQAPPLFRFTVIHLTRADPQQPVTALRRGGVPIGPQALGERELGELARAMTDHLLQRRNPSGFFRGMHEPTTGIYKRPIAKDDHAALTAFVLARRSKLAALARDRRQALESAAHGTLRALLVGQFGDGKQKIDVITPRLDPTAAIFLAMTETPSLAGEKEARNRLATALQVMQQPSGWFRYSSEADARPATPRSHALGAFALARLYEINRNPETLGRTRAALEAAWKTVEQDQTPVDAYLPWLAYAELTLTRLGQAKQRVADLTAHATDLQKKQVTPWMQPEPDPAGIGGFLVQTGLFEEPNWHSARVLTTQALILQQGTWVGAEDRNRWLISGGLGARFLSRLTFSPAACYYTPRPRQALGGVRIALWDNRQPLLTTALGLLALTEWQYALAPAP